MQIDGSENVNRTKRSAKYTNTKFILNIIEYTFRKQKIIKKNKDFFTFLNSFSIIWEPAWETAGS